MVERYATFSRHVGVELLREMRGILVGLGRMGLPIASGLAHWGFGGVYGIDSDVVTERNLPYGYFEEHIGQKKVLAAGDVLRTVNPHVGYLALGEDVDHPEMLHTFLRILEEYADVAILAAAQAAPTLAVFARRGYPIGLLVTAGLLEDGSIGEVAWSMPGVTCCLECAVGLSRKTSPEHGESLPTDVASVVNAACKVVLGLCLDHRDGFSLFEHLLDPERPVLWVVNRPPDVITATLPDSPEGICLMDVGGRSCRVCRGYDPRRFYERS